MSPFGVLLLAALTAPGSHARPKAAEPAPSTEDAADRYRALAADKNLEVIERLEGLLESGRFEGDQKADLMLRLAEAYFAEFRRVRLAEEAANIERADRCGDCPTPATTP